MPAMFRFKITGLDKLMKTYSPRRYRKLLNKHANRYLRRFGYIAVKAIKDEIAYGNMAGLGRAQTILKGDEKLLVQTGDLVLRGFGYKFIKSIGGTNFGISVGVKEGTHSPSGLSYNAIVSLIQEGTSFEPTIPQRLRLQNQLREAGADPPEGEAMPVWVIPPRPFLDRALQDLSLKKMFVDFMTLAANATLNELVKV